MKMEAIAEAEAAKKEFFTVFKNESKMEKVKKREKIDEKKDK